MTTTTAGALDTEDIGQEITVHLPSGTFTGQLTDIAPGHDNMVRLQVNQRHVIVHHDRKITLNPA